MNFTRSELVTIGVLLAVVVVGGFFAFSRLDTVTIEESDASRVLKTSDGESGFTDLDNRPFLFEQYEGKVRVVNAWATWCPFCINELPDFSALTKEFNSDEVVVIAINRKEDVARVRAFVGQLPASEGIIFVQDPADAFYKSIGGFSMPETVFYDKEGDIVFHKRGFMTLNEMKRHTNTALNATND